MSLKNIRAAQKVRKCSQILIPDRPRPAKNAKVPASSRVFREQDIDKMDYATVRRMVHPQKGRWLRFSEEQIQRVLEHEKK